MESSQSSSLVAATLIVCVAGLGVPSLSRAAEVPAPTLILSGDQLPAEDQRAARVELRVDAEDLGEDAGPMGDKISEVCGEVLADEGVADASDPLDPVIIVVIERTGGDDNPGFVVGFSIEKGDEIVPGSTRQADCSLCTRGEVIDKIREELPPLVSLAREHQVPAATGDEGGGEEGGDEDTKAIGPMGFAGIGLGVVGAAGVGVGAAFAARGEVPKEDMPVEATDYRTPGLVVLGVGAAALVTGVVLIALDVSKRKKARGSTSARIEARGAGFAF